MKKIAVMLYPNFSLQEITTLTSCLKLWFDQELEFLGSEKKLYASEEGFQVLPTKTLGEADLADYSCVLLPGTVDPLLALYDERLIAFLKTLKNRNILIAAISSAPLLLAKAGLLKETRFTAGFFMQMLDAFPFIPRENFVHRPVMEDKNVITAIGFAFREFAGAVLNRLGFDPGENFMLPAPQSGREEDFTYYWSDADYREFLEELREYTQP